MLFSSTSIQFNNYSTRSDYYTTDVVSVKDVMFKLMCTVY